MAAKHAAVLLPALLALCAGVWAQGIYPGNAVRVNGVEISYQRFNGFYEELKRGQGINVAARGDYLERLKQLRRDAMDQMIDQELLAQAAEAKGIEVDPAEVDAAMAKLRKPFDKPEEFTRRLETEGYTEESYRDHLRRMIAATSYLDGIRSEAATVSDAELEQFYKDNPLRLTFPEQVRVRHILLTWKPLGTQDDRAALREKMVPILQQARSGADFADLARQHSEDSTAQDGGDTGFFHRGQMVPAFEEAAFALQPGEVSDIVETPFGVHILRLEERKEAHLLPLEEVREQLREYLQEEKAEEAEKQEIARLREAAEIEILVPL